MLELFLHLHGTIVIYDSTCVLVGVSVCRFVNRFRIRLCVTVFDHFVTIFIPFFTVPHATQTEQELFFDSYCMYVDMAYYN